MTWGSGLRGLKRATTAVLDFALPHRCISCGEIVINDAGFCSVCWPKLAFMAGPACSQCALPFDVPAPEGTRCGACLAAAPNWSRASAIWYFEGPARDAVLALKYRDRTEITRHLVPLLMRAGEKLLDAPCVIIPVPLHRWRMARRTFNQSALLATSLAKRSGNSVNLSALERHKSTTPQQGLDRASRLENVKSAFRLNPNYAHSIKGQIIILIDDVYTTGATLNACAKVLLRGGALDVRILTLARVVPSREGAL
jgi:ComF family protein